MDSYKKLEDIFSKMYHLQHLLSLGVWDMRTLMPPKGVQARGAALGELRQHMRNMIVSEETKKLIGEAQEVKDQLSEEQQANLREMMRIYSDQACLPADFVRRTSEAISVSQQAWTRARAENDFSSFLPHFRIAVELAREEARYRSAATGKGLYDALFQMYEPGMPFETVEEVFGSLKKWLPPLLQKIRESRKSIDESIAHIQYPISIEKQEALLRHVVAEVMEFDFEAGRLDVAAHPFSGMTKEDSRITTHYDVHYYGKSLFAGIHESGHSKYSTECGADDMTGQPVCNYRSMAIHESQSRFAEVTVGRSGAFAAYLAPKMKEFLGDQPAFTEENIRRINQLVEPNYIRVMADEVCYPLHVLLRYEIERALVEGTLEADDVPRVWNEKMKEYLGLETEGKDNIGCLQDIHWSQGSFGYFPTYTLGSMFAVQLMATIKKELGEDTVEKCLRSGDLTPIFAKQREKIWSKGCLYETEELMIKATGEKLNPQYFRDYLEKRYLRNED